MTSTTKRTPTKPKTTNSDPILVHISLEIPDVACESIMSTAIEGGIGYWCEAVSITYANETLTAPRPVAAPNAYTLYYAYSLLLEEDDDDIPENHKHVTYDTVRKGLRKLFDPTVSSHSFETARRNFLADYGDWLQTYPDAKTASRGGGEVFGGTMDSIDCDIVIQMGLFGEVVYG